MILQKFRTLSLYVWDNVLCCIGIFLQSVGFLVGFVTIGVATVGRMLGVTEKIIGLLSFVLPPLMRSKDKQEIEDLIVSTSVFLEASLRFILVILIFFSIWLMILQTLTILLYT